MYNEILHRSVHAWIDAFDLARGDHHTTSSADDTLDGTLGWKDETLNDWHKIKLSLVRSVRSTEPHIAPSVVPWITTYAGRASYFGPRIPVKARVVTPSRPPPRDPNLVAALELLEDCGGSMAQENLFESKELIAGGWATEGPLDKFGRKTIKIA